MAVSNSVSPEIEKLSLIVLFSVKFSFCQLVVVIIISVAVIIYNDSF